MLIKLINGVLAWLIIFLFAGTLFAQNKSPYTLAALNMNALSSPEAEPVSKKKVDRPAKDRILISATRR